METLSDKENACGLCDMNYRKDDVKEFIRELKELSYCAKCDLWESGCCCKNPSIVVKVSKINELAGDKLI